MGVLLIEKLEGTHRTTFAREWWRFGSVSVFFAAHMSMLLQRILQVCDAEIVAGVLRLAGEGVRGRCTVKQGIR